MNKYVKEIEAIALRLRGTGGGEAIAAVLDACKLLHAQQGRLDSKNRMASALALCSMLSEKHLSDTIRDLADLIN